MPINYVLLCVIAGIIGLVLTGFTAWHISLAWRGQTTIECLEKTRYLSPLRKSMHRQQYGIDEERPSLGQAYGRQFAEIPGITQVEEGEERPSPSVPSAAGQALRMTYNEMERSRERQRYEDYLDEQDSEKLPNAFDLGWRRNLLHLFGEKPLLWLLPVCNTTGDGWHWEPSPKWLEAREEVRRAKEDQWREQDQRERDAGWGGGSSGHRERKHEGSRDTYQRNYLAAPSGALSEPRSNPPETERYGNVDLPEDSRPRSGMSLRTLRRKSSFEDANDSDDHYEVSSDEETLVSKRNDGQWYGQQSARGRSRNAGGQGEEWREWEE